MISGHETSISVDFLQIMQTDHDTEKDPAGTVGRTEADSDHGPRNSVSKIRSARYPTRKNMHSRNRNPARPDRAGIT